MKRIISLCLIVLFTISLFGCVKKEYSLEIVTEKTTIEIGETLQLTAETDYKNPTFDWSSDDETIAFVDYQGLVTAIAAGTVDIIVKIENVGEKKITITVNSKSYTAGELKNLLNSTLNQYSVATNFSIKINLNDGEKELTSEVILNKTTDQIDSLMYKLSGAETAHVYVKDGYAYLLKDNVKTKSKLTTFEAQQILDDYNFNKMVENLTGFYNEEEFYTAVKFESNKDDVLEFSLDLSAYNGTVFVTEAKDAITVKVSLVDQKVVKVETIVKVGEKVQLASLEFLGTTNQTITFPTDLDSYIEK